MKIQKCNQGLFLILLFCLSCGPTQKVIVNGDYRYKTSVSTVSKGQILPEIADEDYLLSADFAAMSAYIYLSVTDSTHLPKYCGCFTDHQNLTSFMNKWERMTKYPKFPLVPIGTKEIKGLVYDVWISKELPKKAVVVFRGTDFKTLGDWHANAFWVTKLLKKQWNQYAQVLELTPRLIDSIIQQYGPEIRIFSTGHSLGGGLAMQAAFATPKIEKIFTFNTSPVDGYKTLSDDAPRFTTNKRIFRIYEKGEILSALRYGADLFRPLSHSNPEIIQIKYNLLRGDMVTEHGIAKFAESLRKYSTQSSNR